MATTTALGVDANQALAWSPVVATLIVAAATAALVWVTWRLKSTTDTAARATQTSAAATEKAAGAAREQALLARQALEAGTTPLLVPITPATDAHGRPWSATYGDPVAPFLLWTGATADGPNEVYIEAVFRNVGTGPGVIEKAELRAREITQDGWTSAPVIARNGDVRLTIRVAWYLDQERSAFDHFRAVASANFAIHVVYSDAFGDRAFTSVLESERETGEGHRVDYRFTLARTEDANPTAEVKPAFAYLSAPEGGWDQDRRDPFQAGP